MYPRPIIALIAIAISSIFIGANAQATTLVVPTQYSTVGAALDGAGVGDVIEIAPGIYLESDLIVPAGVTITGTGSKPQDVLINGNGEGRILLLESLVETVTIRNITFMNGHAHGPTSYDQAGGALLISNSNARIENCVFSANTADSHGGAIRCTNSSPEIVSCQFYANAAPVGGGGALDLSYNSSPLIRDCEFLANRADWGGALSCRAGSSPRVENGDLNGNTAEGPRGFGGGVFANYFSYPDLLNTTVSDNHACFGGGLASLDAGPINLDYCTVVNNTAGILEGGILIVNSASLITGSIVALNYGRGIVVSGQAMPQITCTDIYDNSMGDWAILLSDMVSKDGNLSVDPQFCSVMPGEENRFHLKSTSPLAQAGSSCGVLGAKPVSCTGEKGLVPVVSAAIANVMAAPNPFNPQTTVSFELAQAQDIRVSIYGLDGRLVHVLGEGMFNVGAHELVWKGRDHSGRQVSSGVYFVMVKGRQDTKKFKVTLLK
ncbi:MAG: right-handed parallel beta-helix repeat-containing protein [Candidatus Krumholzibacteria bacterium]|nr:right-handed parallel beta-helix repeat-containing protein [Candidatus Krumholzibacteria bacterium]